MSDAFEVRNYDVLVKPGSKKGPLVEMTSEDSLTVYIPERPHDGEANSALIKLLSKYFRVSKSQIEIVRGEKSRQKNINIYFNLNIR